MPSCPILDLPKMVLTATKLMYLHELWEHMAMQLLSMSWPVSVITISSMIIDGTTAAFNTTNLFLLIKKKKKKYNY